jgi:hypothetical protein
VPSQSSINRNDLPSNRNAQPANYADIYGALLLHQAHISDSGIHGSGWQSFPRAVGGNSTPKRNSDPTLAPSATYTPPNFATKPVTNSTSVTGNSPTYAGSSTYSPPTTMTGMVTSPPPEFARWSGDTPRPPSTGVGTPSIIDASQLFSSAALRL